MNKRDIISKEKEIKKEITRLKKLFKELDKKVLIAAEGLIKEAAFMRATLSELKEDINSNGTVDELPQGEYSILRESPSVKTYNTMVQRYTSVCKEINNLLPKETINIADDGFEAFVVNR
jgi:3-methyladenine DNA glycosylase AlkD